MSSMTIEQALRLAVGHHNAGRLAEAEPLYRQVLLAAPDNADALHLLGVLLGQRGEDQAAIDLIRRAIAIAADQSGYHFNLGNILYRMGRFDEACGCFGRALKLKPDFAEAHNNLGNAFKDRGQLDQAIACYRRALELKPENAEACNNLGDAWQDKGQTDEALACFRRALQLKPDFAEAHNNQGNACNAKGQFDEAIACCRQALALRADYPEALNNLGNACQGKGQLEQAIACYQRALALKPDYAHAHNNLGIAWKDKGQLDQAIACYQRAAELKPDFAEAHNNLGNACKDKGQLDEALACYQRALALKPGYLPAHDNILIAAQYHPASDPQSLFEAACRWNQQHAAPLAPLIQSHRTDRTPGRRLKIGYVSPDFCDHVVGRNLLPLFGQHDHAQFEIFGYSQVLRPDAMTDRLRAQADHWRSLVGLSDPQAADLIRQDGIDILVDLALHTANNRLLVFARKPAPVQVTFAGYPGTTGLKAIDYRLTDPYLDPPGLFDRYYSEGSFRLAHSFWCFDPADDQATGNALPALQAGYVTFGCLNNFCKVNESMLRLWAHVLGAVAHSRLILLAPEGSHRRLCLEVLAGEGVAAERIEFMPRCSRPQYLELYHRIDIGLDTLPYNGHSTSLDSFWMGVPVITQVGRTVVGRAGLCQLMNLGLEELVAHTPEQFVQIAHTLAADLPRLSALRQTLRQRMERSPLMDSKSFARDIEAAYRSMWKTWCGQA